MTRRAFARRQWTVVRGKQNCAAFDAPLAPLIRCQPIHDSQPQGLGFDRDTEAILKWGRAACEVVGI
jgi:hypothetical protein